MTNTNINSDKPKMIPWERHNLLKKLEPPEPKDVIELIQEIEADGHLDIAAYLSLLFLLGSRAGELLHYKYNWVQNPKGEDGKKVHGVLDWNKYKKLRDAGDFKLIEKPGLRKIDIEVIERKGKEWLKITTRNEKRKKVNLTTWRSVRLPYNNPNYYLQPLIEVFERYCESINFDSLDWYAEIFNFSMSYVTQYLARRDYNLNLHATRHYRCKWLTNSKYENLNSFQLKNFIGWEDLNQSTIYAEASEENIDSQIEKSIKEVKK